MTDIRVDGADDSGERVKAFEVVISDETFTNKTATFEDAEVTAAQIAEAVGAHPVTQFRILQQLTSGEIETKHPTELTNLREAGVERFFVIRSDRTYDFTVDGLSLEWPLVEITGAHLRALARATERQDLVRVTADGFKVVGEGDVVSFEGADIEEFRLTERKQTVTIFYREEPFVVERRRWSTEELMALFEVKSGYKLDLIQPDGEFKEMKPDEIHARRPVPEDELIHHSDRGVQYLAMNYTQRLAEANLVPSVGSVGDSYDNALAETINGLYKAEVIWRQRSWPSASAVEIATLNWVDWFNNHRLFGPIGHMPPAEAEANYYAALENLDMVA